LSNRIGGSNNRYFTLRPSSLAVRNAKRFFSYTPNAILAVGEDVKAHGQQFHEDFRAPSRIDPGAMPVFATGKYDLRHPVIDSKLHSSEAV
jgi:hypothetical protein